MNDRLREIPSVDFILQDPRAGELVSKHGRILTLEAIRFVLADLRGKLLVGEGQNHSVNSGITSLEGILELTSKKVKSWLEPSLVPVINATGVILHTNLGRAPLSRASIRAIEQVAMGYSNLEFDLKRGARGSRLVHAEDLLKRLTGAEAALVVNNNAAALLLALSCLARRKRVVISRTQLVEIGGGFRVPEVMSQSGAKLVEVGATNRVHLRDYEDALKEPSALVLRAHHSNFRIIGFTSEPALVDLVQIAHQHNIWLIDDLGSGALLDTARYGLSHEPTVQESLTAGADLVCFSGDKLLGGPQAGILIGKETIISRLKKHPLARAVRPDKLCLAALSATLMHYLKDEAVREIPIWRMISAPLSQIQQRALNWADTLSQSFDQPTVITGRSTVGGGSLPEETLPTYLLALRITQSNRFLTHLREQATPIIGRVEDERVVLDPRTVLEEEEGVLMAGLRAVSNYS